MKPKRSIDDILKEDSKYHYYYDDCLAGTPPRFGKTVHQQLQRAYLNFFDELYPGAREDDLKMKELRLKKILIGDENFLSKYSKIVQQMQGIFARRLKALGFSARHANQFIDFNIDFSHVKYHRSNDGKEYLSVDPKLGNKYVGLTVDVSEEGVE